jgi:hypothetical protein
MAPCRPQAEDFKPRKEAPKVKGEPSTHRPAAFEVEDQHSILTLSQDNRVSFSTTCHHHDLLSKISQINLGSNLCCVSLSPLSQCNSARQISSTVHPTQRYYLRCLYYIRVRLAAVACSARSSPCILTCRWPGLASGT